MNKVVLIGRLTDEPVIRYTEGNDHSIASYTLAVDRRVSKGESKADFIRMQAWDKKAEFAQNYLHKGTKVAITGRIQTGSYKNKDGVTVYTTDVVVEDCEFCEKKASNDAPAPETNGDEFMSVPDIAEDLPFI